MLSIIMPVYNAGRFLGETIESILNQTYRDFELIIIDDCSTDGSRNVIERYRNIDDRIKTIFLRKQGGASHGREEGFIAAKGEIISFMDADDVIHPRMYELLCLELDKNGADIAICDYSIFDKHRKWNSLKDYEIQIYTGFDVAEAMLLGNCIGSNGVWGKVFKKSLFAQVNYKAYKDIIPTCYFEDGFILPKVYVNAECVVHVKEALYGYRVIMQSLSHNLTNGACFLDQAISGSEMIDFVSVFRNRDTYNQILGRLVDSSIQCALKAYYSFTKYNDKVKKESAKAIFKDLHQKYKNVCASYSKLEAIQFWIFSVSPSLWVFLIGRPYFEVLRHLK